MTRTFEDGEKRGKEILPAALRIIAARLESDDGVESAALRQAADELDEWRANARKETYEMSLQKNILGL